VRRVLIGAGALVLALHAGPRAAQQDPTSDAVPRFLAGIESAVASPTSEAMTRLAGSALATTAENFWIDARGGRTTGAVRAVVRQRELGRAGTDAVVAADLLVSYGRAGVVTTFEATLRPGSGGELTVVGLKPLAQMDGLTRLVLDTEQQFTVRNLEFTAPDLSITVASGEAFAASSESGLTALVLRGRGALRFTPPDAAEQDQLRLLTKQPTLETTVEDLVIRLNPGDLSTHMSAGSLVTSARDARAAAHAQEIFDRTIARTYSIDLGDLSSDRWGLVPAPGNVAIEFRSAKHGWLTYARSAGDPEDVVLFDRERGRNIALYASSAKVAQRGRFFDEDAGAAYDVTRYDVDLAFDPPKSTVSGRGSMAIRVLAPVARMLSFRLAESLNITSVSSPQLGRLLALRVVGQTTVVIALPRPVNAGQEITIDFSYGGRVQPEELGSEAVTVQTPPSEPIDMPPLQRPDPRWVYSNRAYWYPQALTSDYAPARLRVRVPSVYDVVATGARTLHSEQQGARVLGFESALPVRYLAVEISRFTPLGEGRSGGVNLTTLATRRRAGANRTLTASASEMLGFFADAFGDAPYPSLTVTAVDALVPGGHAPAYFAVVQQPSPQTPYTWRDDPLAFDRQPDMLLAHEIAHQWWGQGVGFKSYHDQWLSEGLAQFSALMFIGAARPEAERAVLARLRDTTEEFNASGPIHLGYRLGHIEGRGQPFRAIVYNKSAMVLHMLQRLVGEEPFRRGLQRFSREWRFRKAGTDDLRVALEAETGQSLSRFFDRWILGSSLPRLRATARIDRENRTAHVRIEQIGETFDLPVTVELQYTNGNTETVTLAVRESVVDARIPLKDGIRRVITRDERTLAIWEN
jgi:hypothetical protein